MAMLERFNPYILKTAEKIAAERAGGGYDINSYFTRDLQYGSDCCIRANHPPKTMCVAAVCEIIVEALNLYANETNDHSPFSRLPMRAWTHGSVKDIRAHIFMYSGTGSRGTAHALARFGIGKEIAFEDLVPGDFVNFNRTTTGHAVVFLGFINKSYEIESAYSNRVVGFHYFSAQGKGSADAGFAYRWAFFGSNCPAAPAGKRRDCGVRFSDDPAVLNAGYMLHPKFWNIDVGRGRLEALFLDDAARGDTRPAWDNPDYELDPADLSRLDGVTTD